MVYNKNKQIPKIKTFTIDINKLKLFNQSLVCKGFLLLGKLFAILLFILKF